MWHQQANRDRSIDQNSLETGQAVYENMVLWQIALKQWWKDGLFLMAISAKRDSLILYAKIHSSWFEDKCDVKRKNI